MTDGSDPGRSGSLPPRLARFIEALPFVAIFLVTFAVNIAYSFRQGRLAHVPTHDDIAYLSDALGRLTFAPGSGLWSTLATFWWDPPHAPVSTLTAMLGFWALGPEPVSAYVADAWVLALYIAVMAAISRPLGNLPARTLFVALLAYVPAAHAMVTEFRPDMAGGLLFAIALAAICRTDFRTVSFKRRLALAGLGLAATITKLSAVVLVIPGLGVAFALTLVAQGLFTAPDRRRLFLSGLACVGLYALALVPFAIVFGEETLSYITDTLFNYSDVWVTHGDALFHWLFHFSGFGGSWALGPFAYGALAIVIVDLVLYARYPAYRRKGVLAYSLTLVIVYCAMAISTEKTTFQGSFFYLPFMLAAAAAFVRIAVAARRRWPAAGRRGASGVLATALALAVLFLPLSGSYTPRAEDGPESDRLLPQVTDAIYALRKNVWQPNPACKGRVMQITVMNYDPLTPGAIQMAVAKGGINLRSRYVFFPRSLDEALALVDEVDLVVMADPSAKTTNEWLLVTPMVPDIFRHLSEKPGVEKIQVGTYRDKPFWLFAKRDCTDQR